MVSLLLQAVDFPPCLLTFKMTSIDIPCQDSIRQKDEQLLATLGYKQEFKRAFTPLEVIDFRLRYPKFGWFAKVFGVAFSIIGLLPSIASVLFYAIPNGGGPAMVWGVSYITIYLWISLTLSSVVSGECIRFVHRHCHGRACVSSSNFWRCTYDKFCGLSESYFTINSSIFGPIPWLLHDGKTFCAGSSDVRHSSIPMQVSWFLLARLEHHWIDCRSCLDRLGMCSTGNGGSYNWFRRLISSYTSTTFVSLESVLLKLPSQVHVQVVFIRASCYPMLSSVALGQQF